VTRVASKFDPYREALVIEEITVWPEEYDDWDPEEKARVEAKLHADPENAVDMDYERLHTGFARVINVTDDDVARAT